MKCAWLGMLALVLGASASAAAGRMYSFTGTVTGVSIGTISVKDGKELREFTVAPGLYGPGLGLGMFPKAGDRVRINYILDVQEILPIEGQHQQPGRRGDGEGPLKGFVDDRAFFEATNDRVPEKPEITGT